MDLESYREHEVLVRDLPVTIFVEILKNIICLLRVHRKPQMRQELDKFMLLDVFIVVFVEVFECFSHSTPFCLDFFN